MKKYQLCGALIVFSLLFSSNVFAYYCSTPQGNGFINVGDSMDKVRQACGTPTSEQTAQVPVSDKISTTQYWLYENIQVLEQSPLAVQGATRSVNRLGPSFVVEVKNNSITAITQGESSVQSTNQCDQGVARVGDSIDKLISACGKPSFVNVETGSGGGADAPKKEQTTWVYQAGAYAAPLTLIFEEGQLTSINGSTSTSY